MGIDQSIWCEIFEHEWRVCRIIRDSGDPEGVKFYLYKCAKCGKTVWGEELNGKI